MVLFINRVLNRLKRIYRKKCFREITGCPHNDFSIVGDITVINKNITLGKGVTIYPGCLFFGDGEIVIGDGVDIGKDCVIYASAKNGGVKIGSNTSLPHNATLLIKTMEQKRIL